MQKTTDVHGVGNLLTDIVLPVDFDFLDNLSFEAGSAELVSAEEQAKLLSQITGKEERIEGGGSVANSIVMVSELGGRSSLSGKLGDDVFGQLYLEELNRARVHLGNPLIIGGQSGTAVSLVTPDGERTMRASLGLSRTLSPEDIDTREIELSKWLFVEAYLLENSEVSKQAMIHAVSQAKKHGAQVALTLSDRKVVERNREKLEELLEHTDLLLTNKKEGMEISGAPSGEEAFEVLRHKVPNLVVTLGSKGALALYNGKEARVDSFPTTVVDTTGAGDAFAGGFLYGITNGYSVADSARGGSYLASKVIEHLGARLKSGADDFWNQSLE